MPSAPVVLPVSFRFGVGSTRVLAWGAAGALAAVLGLEALAAQDSLMPALPGSLHVAGTAAVAGSNGADAALDPTAILAARREVATTLQGRRETLVLATVATTTAGTTDASSADQAWQAQEIDLWERLDSIYAEQLRAVSAREDLAAKVTELESRQSQPAAADHALVAPPTFERLEQLYDQRDFLANARDWLERDRSDAADDLRDAETAFSDRERERRALREKSAADPAQFLGGLRLAEISSRIASETVRLRRHALDTLQVQSSLTEPGLRLVLPELVWVREHLVASAAEAEARVAQRKARTVELRAKVELARQDVDRAAVALSRHEAGPETTTAVAALDPWRETRRLAGSRLSLLGRQLLRIEETRGVEERRLAALFRTVEQALLKTWAAENTERLRRLDGERRQAISDLIRSRRQAEARGARGDTPPATAAANLDEALARETAARQRWDAAAEQEVTELDGLRTACRRLQEELDAEVAGFSVGALWTGTGHVFTGLWDYELFSVGDQPVRVRTLLVVLVLVVAGLFLARRISRLVGHLAHTRLKWSRGRAAAWQTLLFYGFTIFIVLNIFGLFHLSLTQFTVISGALAVGLGFGSQNLINNFLSGIILLVERPIAEGDLIELDGAQLWVQHIGMRSTIVRSFDNTHVIVPNSRLLDQPVTNWTLSDDVVRLKIAVGVAYGSDTRQVEHVLRAVLAEVKQALAEPAPLILFAAFGDNALEFQVIFHAQIDARFEALTEVRHAIVEAFAAAGIVIAFPQRDLHLDTTRPLEIRLTTPAAGTAEAVEPPPVTPHLTPPTGAHP